MEDVAKAGGFEEHGKLKAQKEVTEKMNKISVEKWINILGTVTLLDKIIDKGGLDVSLIAGWTSDIKETIKSEIELAISPLKNEIMAGINAALAPIMPYISVAVNNITSFIGLGFASWTALFTGKWDDFERRLEEMFPGIGQAKEDYMKHITEEYWSGPVGRAKIEAMLAAAGLPTIAVLEASALAGGVYSGQFDINLEALAKMLENLELPDYTEG